ncbi:MAG: hypothetical protein Q6367_012960 [Candidatus Freyarchaeota archaeon]
MKTIDRTPKSIMRRTLKPKLVGTLIEDTQELQIITKTENGGTKYRLNHQILEATQKTNNKNKYIVNETVSSQKLTPL